ncbi:hypothetical protein D187_001629 [Cystobacter fuscus DSM 2262]|uniref:Polyketide cyclase / dehydrase and lipid transport n=1 Tax=Cystobacter fuscus (strain ATCC 25194 / DSM 2262 / NBRC 100088 / M29) TaxID=1242864 RepID=S9PF25_CYSF2|nr:SRPBCC family protein [Cystobacter fuscus]EPX60977.1 hypothetical protein D187_001629 [Cystobacter fuscus DSM 2262]
MPKKILIAFASLLGLLLVIGLLLPTTYRVERSLLILAPPEAVYAQVAQPRHWGEWTPWNAERYPGGQWMFGGPELGAGSVRTWEGGSLGRGTLSLSEADPKTGVAYQASLDGGRFSARGRISLASAEGGTQVTWVDEGSLGRSPLRRYLAPFIRSRLGAGLEQGLARLKQVAESSKDVAPSRETPAGAGPTPSALPDAPGASPVIAAPPVLPPAEPTVSAPVSEPTATPSPGGTPPVLAADQVVTAPTSPTDGGGVSAPEQPAQGSTGGSSPGDAGAAVPPPAPGDAGTPR